MHAAMNLEALSAQLLISAYYIIELKTEAQCIFMEVVNHVRPV